MQESEPQWNQLLSRSRGDRVFLVGECIRSWWEVFGGDHRLLVLVAREGRQVRDAAPLMVGRGETLRRRQQ